MLFRGHTAEDALDVDHPASQNNPGTHYPRSITRWAHVGATAGLPATVPHTQLDVPKLSPGGSAFARCRQSAYEGPQGLGRLCDKPQPGSAGDRRNGSWLSGRIGLTKCESDGQRRPCPMKASIASDGNLTETVWRFSLPFPDREGVSISSQTIQRRIGDRDEQTIGLEQGETQGKANPK